MIGDNPPATASWGYCNRDYPRSAIVSPYKFKTAQEHYDALLAETKARGGPTQHTYATVPGEWSGRYVWPRGQNWYAEMIWNQYPTLLSLLTEEYQTRMVQEAYHDAHTNAPQWPAQYCWPEGFMRRWHYHGVTNQPHHLIVTPTLVQFLAGDADNFITNIHIGRSFNLDGPVPRLGADVPQWYGETIGFWDGDKLITWTANVQGWTITHALLEYSSKLETVEIISPRQDANGAFAGLTIETIFYDPDAFVAPLRSTMRWNRTQKHDSPTLRHTFIECLSNVRNVNGRPTQLSPSDPAYVDYYGRPWAKNWEKHFEQGLEKPDTELPAEILDIFK
jgi:hypothetical protein